MRVDSITYTGDKYKLSITFSDEIEERMILQAVINRLSIIMPVNCLLTDLDTSYSTYTEYFGRNKYYVYDRLTTVSIFAFDLTLFEVQEVISNWGYFTIDAVFALGVVGDEVKKRKHDITDLIKSLPVVITQVLDCSVNIAIDQCHFKDISGIIEV